MKISGMGAAPQPMAGSPSMAEDAVSKSIKKQIADAQKKLQELSSNDSISAEEKMKKRQELQKQISDLNNQLRQHQIEQRREVSDAAKKRQKQDSSMDELIGKKGRQENGISPAGMKAMISADAALGQAKVQESAATKMEGQAGVLKAEIAQDAGRGGVEAKQEELAKTERRITEARSAQTESLADAAREVKEAAQTKSRSGKDEKDGIKNEDKEKKPDEGREQLKETSAVNNSSVDVRL